MCVILADLATFWNKSKVCVLKEKEIWGGNTDFETDAVDRWLVPSILNL